jgi:undecaprenyl diphosphate synthase
LNQKLPQHVAIIMDGNGRWAERHGLPRSEGHRLGVDVVKTIVKDCVKKGIKVLSVWAFGSENWSRPIAEVDFLMQLFVEALKRELDELYAEGVCLRFTGDRSQLSIELQEQMKAAELLTNANSKLILNVVINYGGKWDIVQAAKKIASQVVEGELTLDDINEQTLMQLLNTHGLPDPDLFIRTSGEQRISNFFLWQLAYTELYFSPVCWPDFNVDEFENALLCFSSRERRFGKTSKQIIEDPHV